MGPLVSTVIARDEQNTMTESLDRRRYVASEMPQAFRASVITSAYDQCTLEDYEHGTECLLLAMKYAGVRATILDGSPDLWKVTYKKDLYAVEGLMKEYTMRVQLQAATEHQEFADAIRAELESRQLQLVEEPGGHVQRQLSPSSPDGRISSANTFVLFHTDLNDVDTVDGLRAIQQAHCATQLPDSPLIDRTFLHIFLAPGDAQISEWQAVLSPVMMGLAARDQSKHLQMLGVLASVNKAVDLIARMAVTTLVRGHMDFSGQIFLVL